MHPELANNNNNNGDDDVEGSNNTICKWEARVNNIRFPRHASLQPGLNESLACWRVAYFSMALSLRCVRPGDP